ncbi:MAG: hypothetical protein Q9159_004384 [Coniocarpon cinnabarinum]
MPNANFGGKTVIVSGANAGIGLESVQWLIKLKASTIILAVRNAEKGAAAQKELEKRTGCSPDTLRVWDLDMSSFDSVKRFAARVNNELPRLDAVILNAGIIAKVYELVEGDESSFTVNVVSTYLCALLLLPALRMTADQHKIKTHLCIVGSDTHLFAAFPGMNAPDGQIFSTIEQYRPERTMQDRYATTKLIQVFVMRAIAERLGKDSPVIINNVNPGLCVTDMTNDNPNLSKFFLRVFGRAAESGARAVVAGVCGDETTHGTYMNDGHPMTPAKIVVAKDGHQLQERVWDELSTRLEHASPGVTKVI